MNTVFAVYSGSNLERYADSVNSCTTSDVRFYVNGNTASVSRIYSEMSEEEQLSQLKWFLENREYKIA